MNDDYVFRPANLTLAEAEALLAVEHRSLGDSPYEPPEILALLQRPEQRAYVITQAGQVVGFCSCFETPAEQGPQLEVDLLGIAPEHQGRGLATRLLRHVVADALARGVRRLRGIVALDNIASLRAFQRAGFTPSPQPFDLMVYPIHGYIASPFLPPGWSFHLDEEARAPATAPALSPTGRERYRLCDVRGQTVAQAESLRVATLAYQGLWIEHLEGDSDEVVRAMARAVVERAKQLNLDEVGYLIPTSGEKVEPSVRFIALLREGYQRAGNYLILTLRAP